MRRPVTAQQAVTETRDPRQQQDPEFAKAYAKWTTEPRYGSPLVDHLPRVAGIPSPKDVLGYYIGQPKTLTYYADALKYYRALEKAAPGKVKIETIGKSDEGRELVIVWISSEANIRNLATNRANLAKIADPRGMSEAQVNALINSTKPHYHLMGGLHCGEVGPSEMLLELAYRLVAETSPLINQIRENVYVSITPQADPDGRDRNVDWFYRGLDMAARSQERRRRPVVAAAPACRTGANTSITTTIATSTCRRCRCARSPIGTSPRIRRSCTTCTRRAQLMYTYSGGPPQNPNLDPLLFAELPFFSNWEMSQMTKWGMPGVYTHAFMDGWSPGYLGSVAYNHNGMMRMYETQSGVDAPTAQRRPRRAVDGRAGGADSSGDSGLVVADAVATRRVAVAVAVDEVVVAAARLPQHGAQRRLRGGGAGGRRRERRRRSRHRRRPDRTWRRPAARVVSRHSDPAERSRHVLAPQQHELHADRRAVGAAADVDVPEPRRSRTSTSRRRTRWRMAQRRRRTATSFPMQRDMTKVATLINVLRAQGIEVGTLNAPVTIDSVTYAAGSYVVKLDQPYGRLAKNLLEKQDYPDPALRTYDDSGWSMGFAFNVDVKEIRNKTILDARRRPSRPRPSRVRSPARARRPAWRWHTSARTT